MICSILYGSINPNPNIAQHHHTNINPNPQLLNQLLQLSQLLEEIEMETTENLICHMESLVNETDASGIDISTENGSTALHIAAMNGYDEIVKKLITYVLCASLPYNNQYH
tara:strand:- start:58 stop:390 length:333 start_codon:yes stop_codon:yes gene_type:complete